MGIFDKLAQNGTKTPQNGYQEMRTEMGRIQQNPVGYLRQRGFKIPDGLTDPRQITQHLLQSGQVGSSRLQMIMRMLGR